MKRFTLCLLILLSFFVLATLCSAADNPSETARVIGLSQSLRYIAACLAVGLCAIATGIAQSRIGAAGMGSIVEKPETAGTVIICIAIPETMVILGFVVAAMIIIL